MTVPRRQSFFMDIKGEIFQKMDDDKYNSLGKITDGADGLTFKQEVVYKTDEMFFPFKPNQKRSQSHLQTSTFGCYKTLSNHSYRKTQQ